MYQVLVLSHILAATLWVGGLLFMVLVIVPATRHLPPPERARLFNSLGRRFRVVGWSALAVLVATGLLLAGYRGVYARLETWRFPAGVFDQVLLAKVLVVATMLVTSALHDFVLGPRGVRQAAAPAMAPAGRWSAWLARVTTVLAVVAVALAVLLARGLP